MYSWIYSSRLALVTIIGSEPELDGLVRGKLEGDIDWYP